MQDATNYRGSSGPSDVIYGTLVSNSPQLAISFLYIIYNKLFSTCFVIREWHSFSMRPQGLRVTRPKEKTAQRRAHFLQVPIRFRFLFALLFLLIHFFTSQSLFLHRTLAIWPAASSPDGSKQYYQSQPVSRLGYSPLSLAWLTICLLILLVCGVVLPTHRYPGKMPLTAGKSVVVSAACHPPEGHHAALPEKFLMWRITKEGEGGQERGSFTSLNDHVLDGGESFGLEYRPVLDDVVDHR